MSTPQRGQRNITMFVPGYLIVFGLFLVGSTVWLLLYAPDELFTAILALVGGLTMLASAVLLLTWGRGG